MVTCTLREKKYSVDFVSGRALREMEPASKMYGKLVALSKAAVEGQDVSDEKLTIPEALDTMVKWFCILFGGQFSPDDVYDHYPADRLMLNYSERLRLSPNSPERQFMKTHELPSIRRSGWSATTPTLNGIAVPRSGSTSWKPPSGSGSVRAKLSKALSAMSGSGRKLSMSLMKNCGLQSSTK